MANNQDSMMIRAHMARLVREAGGVEAAAALISAETGNELSKGTVSKCNAGLLEWKLVDILALERAVGLRPVSRWVADGVPEIGDSASLMNAVAAAAKEHGEAIAAVIAASMGTGSLAIAKRELQEATVALQSLTATLAGLEGDK
jgi:hypothetical protein